MTSLFTDGIQIIWSKMDGRRYGGTIIAIGSTIFSPKFYDRFTVSVDERGSTLQIGIAQSKDAGQYKCSVAVRGTDNPELQHYVRIEGL